MSMRLWKLWVPIVAVIATGCAIEPKRVPPPTIVLDPPVLATPLPEPPAPVEVIAVPKPLPLPEQLKRLPKAEPDRATSISIESEDPQEQVAQAVDDARVPPNGEQYLNAIQVWPYSDGALYQVYASPGRVTAIVLEEGEELVAVSAGDTARWLVGDTASGSGTERRITLLVKPVRSGLTTNLVIATSRRSYFLELTSTESAWMASVSWVYPHDRLLALERQSAQAKAMAPIESGVRLERLRFRYALSGDRPPWRPLRAFDDGERVYVQFPGGIGQGELPPLFVIGPEGDGQLVNYRFRSPYLIVDRMFGAAELRLGGDAAQVVRIERTDGVGPRAES